MSDTNSPSVSDRIVSEGRQERAAKMAQGLDPTEDVPKMSLMNKTPKETREQYLKRCAENRLKSNFGAPETQE